MVVNKIWDMVVNKIGRKNALLLGGVLVLGLLPIALQGNARILNVLIAALMWGVLASAWDLCIGYARVFSFGHLAFFTIGAYTAGLTARQLGIPPEAAIPLGGVTAAIFGLVIGLLCLRLHGVYIAMVTFGLHMVLQTVIIWARDVTGGKTGVTGFAPLQIGQYIFSPSYPFFSYYIALGIFILLLFIIYRVINSPIGLAFVSLRDSELFAKSLGINAHRYKLIVFSVSAFIAGLIGAVYIHFYGIIAPVTLDVHIFLMVLIMLILGGLGRFPGAVIGAFVITFVTEALRPLLFWRFVALGAIVVAVMVTMPGGLMAVPEKIMSFSRRIFGRRHVEKEAPKA